MTTMASLLERKLIVVTGKGGTGKTTVACALGLLAARQGLRTIVVEVGDQHRIPDLFAAERSRADHFDHVERTLHSHHGRHVEEAELQENLWSTSIDPDRALIEWLQTLTGRISARLLAASSTFQYFAAAAPGAKELVSMVKVRELCEGQPRRGSTHGETPHAARPYDLVVLDAPATGHALAMLRSPQTFAAIVRAGPLAEQAERVRELLEDRRRSGYVGVANATEMAVAETLELEQGLRRHIDRDLDAVVVNGTIPRRFTREELGRIATLDGAGDHAATDASHLLALETPAENPYNERDAGLLRSAAAMARTVHERARLQQSQIARLRRQRFADGMPPGVVTVPFIFTPELDLAAVREIATHLARKL
jgi:anion-transporting  ArsA/GET3 family ATPase